MLLPGRDSTFASNFTVTDKISHHMALHVSLACQRHHPVYVRALRRINNNSLEDDLACLNIDIECDDVNVVVAQYDTSLSRLLDEHAPLKIYVLLIDP